MRSPKTTNTLEDGSGNVQIGDNSGTVNIGLTLEQVEQHARLTREQLVSQRADLEAIFAETKRANAADRKVQEIEINTLREKIAENERRLENPEKTYQEYLARIAELEQLLKEATVEIGANRISDAQQALEAGDETKADAIFAEVEAHEQAAVGRAASAAYGRGLIAENAIRWSDAAEHYKKAARHDPSFDHLDKAREFTWRMGAYDDALQWGEALLATARADGDEDRIAQASNGHALTLKVTGQFAAAEPLYREAQAITRKTLGPEHPDYAIRLINLAALLEAKGRYEEAEPLYREAQAITRKTHGPEHPQYGAALNNLAELLRATGRYEKAEPLYREAQAITRKTLGPEHPQFATDLNNLALLLKATGRYEEAEPLYREAQAITRKTLGPEHPQYGAALNNLAGLLRETGRYEEAEPLYREAQAITRKTLGPEHPDYATRLNNLAVLLRETGRYEEAEPLYREAQAITRKTLGPEHPDYATRLNNLAVLLRATGRYEKAVPLYREAVEILENTLGPDHPNTQAGKANLAALLEERRKSDAQ